VSRSHGRTLFTAVKSVVAIQAVIAAFIEPVAELRIS
jgi:hypothetical protein